MKLTESEKQAIANGETIHITENGVKIIALRADLYEKNQEIFYTDKPLSEEEQLAALRQGGERAGWNDPEMDVYDDLDPRNQQ